MKVSRQLINLGPVCRSKYMCKLGTTSFTLTWQRLHSKALTGAIVVHGKECPSPRQKQDMMSLYVTYAWKGGLWPWSVTLTFEISSVLCVTHFPKLFYVTVNSESHPQMVTQVCPRRALNWHANRQMDGRYWNVSLSGIIKTVFCLIDLVWSVSAI